MPFLSAQDAELIEMLTEGTTMSKTIEEYGDRKSQARPAQHPVFYLRLVSVRRPLLTPQGSPGGHAIAAVGAILRAACGPCQDHSREPSLRDDTGQPCSERPVTRKNKTRQHAKSCATANAHDAQPARRLVRRLQQNPVFAPRVCAAPTLNAAGLSRVTLSLR